MKAIRRQKTSVGENPQTANPSSDSSEAMAFSILFCYQRIDTKKEEDEIEAKIIRYLIIITFIHSD